MADNPTSFQFPCMFPVKVMGHNTPAFAPAIKEIFDRHVAPGEYTVASRPSSGGKYLSITVTFTARSMDQLNALYEELNGHDLVVMTL